MLFANVTQATHRLSKQRLLLKIHQLAGLKLSIFMTYVLLTGTLAVFSDELDWLLNSKLRVAPSSEVRMTLGALTDIAVKTYPEFVIRRADSPKSQFHAAAFLIQDREGHYSRLFIDPYTGNINGVSQYLNVRRFLREMHRNLMLPTSIGIPIVSTMAFLLLVSLITGVMAYKKFWKGFFKLPSGKNLAAYWSSLHRILGVWSIWFILLVVLTSFWYLFENLGGRAESYRHVFTAPPSAERTMSLRELQRIVQLASPKLEVTQIWPSVTEGRPTLFYGSTGEMLVRDRANFVTIHPQTGEVLDKADTDNLTIHQIISEMADPLHFGNFAGLTSRLIWFVFGLFLTLLSISAMRMYSLKVMREFSKDSCGWYRLKTKLGVWYWISIGFIATAFIAWPFRDY